MITRVLLGIAALGMMIPFVLEAQDPPPLRGRAAERVEQFKKIRMMEDLKLDEEGSIRFFTRYNSHQSELRALGEKRDSLVDEMQALVQRNASEAEYQRVYRQMRTLPTEVAKLRESYFEEVAKVLTPGQFARYIVFERNFYRDLRETMRDMQSQRGQRRFR